MMEAAWRMCRCAPVLTSFRPYHRCRSFDAPHQFSADLHLIDWLEEKGVSYDVITDHELHREGVDVLKPYSAITSSTHAEILEYGDARAMDEYLAHGEGASSGCATAALLVDGARR
ncbi:MAG: DUF6605 domain-containing protein [Parvularculaceae bacterium]